MRILIYFFFHADNGRDSQAGFALGHLVFVPVTARKNN